MPQHSFVQGKIQFEYIDSRFSKKPKLPRFGMCAHKLTNTFFGHSARFRHTWNNDARADYFSVSLDQLAVSAAASPRP
jgi:hypothetical protein